MWPGAGAPAATYDVAATGSFGAGSARTLGCALSAGCFFSRGAQVLLVSFHLQWLLPHRRRVLCAVCMDGHRQQLFSVECLELALLGPLCSPHGAMISASIDKDRKLRYDIRVRPFHPRACGVEEEEWMGGGGEGRGEAAAGCVGEEEQEEWMGGVGGRRTREGGGREE